MMIRLLTVLALLFLATPVFAQQSSDPDKVFNAEYFKLDNGLAVIVIPNHRTPVVTHMVWYRVGSADEPHGKSGIAHFLEHLMFKGSLGLEAGQFSEVVRSLGGNDNAFTGKDYTAYFQSIATQHLPLVMRMEAGRMRGLNPSLNQVQSERDVIIEERRQRTDNDPRAQFSEQLSTALFVNHPYGNPVIGWEHEMTTLSWGDAKSFYDRWYGPNNAILVVSGDVTGKEVHALAKEIYGPLPKINVPERSWTKSPPLHARVSITMQSEKIKQPSAQITMRAPSARQNKQQSLALDILQEIMGGGPTSRLYKSLVVEKKIASNAGFAYNGVAWDDGKIVLYGTPLPDFTPKEIVNALNDELRLLIETGVTDQELNDAISRMRDEAVYARDSLTGPAMIFGQSLITGLKIKDVEYWPRDIATVTKDQILAVAKNYLDPDNPTLNPSVDGYLLPATQESSP